MGLSRFSRLYLISKKEIKGFDGFWCFFVACSGGLTVGLGL